MAREFGTGCCDATGEREHEEGDCCCSWGRVSAVRGAVCAIWVIEGLESVEDCVELEGDIDQGCGEWEEVHAIRVLRSTCCGRDWIVH